MNADRRFSELVSLACHDLRTPLATVAGFASTLLRLGTLDAQGERYIRLIEAATGQLADITDQLGLAARVAGGLFEPSLERVDSLELARAAVERLGGGQASAHGEGAPVHVDRTAATSALAGLLRAALRHGGLKTIELRVDGPAITAAPLVEGAARVVVGDELRDLGAATGRAVIEALGGSIEQAGEALVVRLPPDS
ncbi:MAG: histidine kinase dimerization/phospho-acceptor domain-containing protein [Gaiellaceae bacterium]